MFFLPRTPRWLAGQDRWEEAIRVLANLHGNGDIGHPKVLAQYREIEEALRFEREEAASSFRALTEPRMFNRVMLGMAIQMWSQLCGMNILVRLRAPLCSKNLWTLTRIDADVLHCVRYLPIAQTPHN